MNNVRLINFRNIADSGEIELKPLTILVGKNGSGKSSFLRFFPLLQQSVEVAKRGPFLWYNEKGVDFGDFNSTVRENSNSLQIGFSLHYGRKSKKMYDIRILLRIVEDKTESIGSEKGISYDRVDKLELTYLGNKVIVSYVDSSKTKIVINGITMPDAVNSAQLYGLFPNISMNNENGVPGFRELIDALAENGKYKYRDYFDFVNVSFDDFQNLVSGKNLSYNIKDLYCNIIYNYLDQLLMDIQMQIRVEMDNVTYIGEQLQISVAYFFSLGLYFLV